MGAGTTLPRITSLALSATRCHSSMLAGGTMLRPFFFICTIASSFCLRTSVRVRSPYSRPISSSFCRRSAGMRSQTSRFTTVAPVRNPQRRSSMLSAFSKMCVV
jgi:hypothetical protein